MAVVAIVASTANAQAVYVDSAQTPSSSNDGTTPALAYHSLSFAIGQNPSAAVFKVAGRGGGAYAYRDDGTGVVRAEENFPINVPAGVTIEYWDMMPPPSGVAFVPAVFEGWNVGTGQHESTCFRFSANPAGGQSAISAYRHVSPPTSPVNDGQGIQITQFDLGVEVVNNWILGVGVTAQVQGVYIYDCGQAFKAQIRDYTSAVSLSRSVIRGYGGNLSISAPMVECQFTDNTLGVARSCRFDLMDCDIRPGDQAVSHSAVMIAGTGGESADLLSATITNVVISGQPAGPIALPAVAQTVGGAGVDFGLKGGIHGSLVIDNLHCRDCQAEGVLAFATSEGTVGQLFINDSKVEQCGLTGTSSGSSLGVAGFSSVPTSESGLHVILNEGAEWSTVDGDRSKFTGNYRHGAYFEGSSYSDHLDAFQNVDFDLCLFYDNGNGGSVSGQCHGLYARLSKSMIDVNVHRSVLSKNRTSGIKMLLEDGSGTDIGWSHRLEITTSTISLNEGQGTQDQMVPSRDICPITVESRHDNHYLEIQLSHVTVSDNPNASFAVSLWGNTATSASQERLWPVVSNSAVENSVLRENSGGQFDMAYYPDAATPNPQFPAQDQWLRMMSATSHSDVGSAGSVTQLTYPSPGFHNFDLPAALGTYSLFGLNLGKVMISGAPLQNTGGTPSIATEPTDNRGGGFPRPALNIGPNLGHTEYDVGAYEKQQ